MRAKILLTVCLMTFFVTGLCQDDEMGLDGMSLKGFLPLFDGSTLNGWAALADGPGEGGLWIVADGAIVGEQGPNREGGILITAALYSDYEVYAEIKADYPIDSGLFLRIQPEILSYQVTIDYRPDGEVGAIYSPGGGGFLVHNPDGKDLWKKGEFNAVRARIKGQPPHIEAWINGKKVADFQDSLVEGKARVPENGAVGIQVHPGGTLQTGNKVTCRKILIKNLID